MRLDQAIQRAAADWAVRPSWLILAALVLTCAVPGCVHRRLTIRSNPPGALVLLDGKEIGYTPVSTEFTYYGTREVTLVKDGYERMTVYPEVAPPWYQVFPLEFFTDNLLGDNTTDRRKFTYQLQPQVSVSNQDLIQRGRSLRSEATLGL